LNYSEAYQFHTTSKTSYNLIPGFTSPYLFSTTLIFFSPQEYPKPQEHPKLQKHPKHISNTFTMLFTRAALLATAAGLAASLSVDMGVLRDAVDARSADIYSEPEG
jgi:hypothetical protein